MCPSEKRNTFFGRVAEDNMWTARIGFQRWVAPRLDCNDYEEDRVKKINYFLIKLNLF